MNKNDKIEPTVLKGTRDLLPSETVKRAQVMKKIENVFQQFGYQQIETPILSKAETILGKEQGESSKISYTFKDAGKRDVALPFDLTMPFARYVAAHWQELPMPFKRYQIQKVWRGENVQRGRLREFYQCDVDIIGSDSLLCEAEITKLIEQVFNKLKIKNIKIKVNSRKLLNQILNEFDVKDTEEAIRLIDKLDKIGANAVIKSLEQIGVKRADELIDLLLPAENNQKTLAKLSRFDTADIQKFIYLTGKLKVNQNKISIDPSLARGLDYYTGLIFEVVSPDSDLGTICAGGRYDNLTGIFSKQEFSGIGVSFGFERIMILLGELGLDKKTKLKAETLVTIFNDELMENSLKIYNLLIKAELPAEIYFESDKKLDKQLKYADKKNLSFAIIQGPDEAEKNEVIVKMLASGRQKKLPLDQLVGYIAEFYNAEQ